MEFVTNIQMIREDKIYLSSFAFIENYSNLRRLEMENSLHSLEHERYDSFKNENRKINFLSGRYCAKKAISNLCNIQILNQIHIDSGIFNQPIIKSSGISNMRVSISHDKLASIALAYPEEHPMSIDIESVDMDKTSEIEDFLTPHEVVLINNFHASHNLVIMVMWTAKESLSKVLNTGLTTSLSVLEIKSLELDNVGNYRCTFTNFYQYQTISITHKDKVITMILPRHTEVAMNIVSSFNT